jgi:Fe-S oxidoreductase
MFRRPSLLKDTIQVLEALGVDFEVPLGLGCCGSVLRRTGHGMDRARERNMRLLEGRKVITSCAGCYSTLRDDYKGLEVMHISEMLAPRMGGLGLHEVKMRVAYHDPCHLGRGMGVYEEPRAALRAIPGLEVMEMAESKERGRCCGGGGGVRSARRDISTRLAKERCAEARGRGAEAIATSCPFCELNLGEQMPTEDVVELVARSLRGGRA